MIDKKILEKKLQDIQQASQRSSYVKLPMHKLTEGKTTIRILQNKFQPNWPFVERYVYYNFPGGKIFVSPITYGDKDPIAEYKGLVNDKSLQRYFSTTREILIPIIVRDENKEPTEVQYLKISNTIYEGILEYLNDDDYGDITDLETGRDIVLNYIPKEKSSTKKYPETEITLVKPKQTPALSDPKKLSVLMETQINLIESFGGAPSYEELNIKLENFISSLTDNPDREESEETSTVNYTKRFDSNKPAAENREEKVKKATSDFDDIFGDD